MIKMDSCFTKFELHIFELRTTRRNRNLPRKLGYIPITFSMNSVHEVGVETIFNGDPQEKNGLKTKR